MFSGILRGSNRIKTERVRIGRTERTPPVCHELACRSISRIIPQYRLNCLIPANSRHSKESELALCLMPLVLPNFQGSTYILCHNVKNEWQATFESLMSP